jgi:hypothetical protein
VEVVEAVAHHSWLLVSSMITRVDLPEEVAQQENIYNLDHSLSHPVHHSMWLSVVAVVLEDKVEAINWIRIVLVVVVEVEQQATSFTILSRHWAQHQVVVVAQEQDQPKQKLAAQD